MDHRRIEIGEPSLVSFGCAVVFAWRSLTGRPALDPIQIVSHPGIAASLDLLPQVFKNRFRAWFGTTRNLENAEIVLNDIEKHVSGTGELANVLATNLFSSEEIKRSGSIFTPTWLAQRLTNEAVSSWRHINAGKKGPKLVGDFSCGPGVFLQELISIKEAKSIIGVDSCQEYVCLARLLTLADERCRIHAADTLTDLSLSDQKTLFLPTTDVSFSDYDVIIGNPPYVRSQLLKEDYANKLRALYPVCGGNFDLVIPFISHAIDALAEKGVAGLVLSSKFMSSRYGKAICADISRKCRMLQIVDFGDGQVFPGSTTYTCTMMFARARSTANFTVVRFPPGIKWDNASSFKEGDSYVLPQSDLDGFPWLLTASKHDEVMGAIKSPKLPMLTEFFPEVSQGVRTGANNVFVLDSKQAQSIEKELLIRFVSGENIRPCKILTPDRFLLWPYTNRNGSIRTFNPETFQHQYPNGWKYLNDNKPTLLERNLDPNTAWYLYSRSQSLDLQSRPKIIGREILPSAEFACDIEGQYALCSGYALIAPRGMSVEELRLWTAVLCTQTMEFQLRNIATQLHSGWFRILKHHLTQVRLPHLQADELREACQYSNLIHQDSENSPAWDALDALVADGFKIGGKGRSKITSYLSSFHAISKPQRTSAPSISGYNTVPTPRSHATCYPDIPAHLKQRFVPVELAQFNVLHRERYDLGRAVVFSGNKTAPIHRWYKFTQGFSHTLVTALTKELDVKTHHTVYDPFSGSGTTLLACKALGIPCYGAEVSPFLVWITKQKIRSWKRNDLKHTEDRLKVARPKPGNSNDLLFQNYFSHAYAPQILAQVVGWQSWITSNLKGQCRDFVMFCLTSLLEEVSQIRKHGSHYRFLNKDSSVGLEKLNIPLINDNADLKPLILKRFSEMFADVVTFNIKNPCPPCQVYELDSRFESPAGVKIDAVITSPPYLNRNNYLAQQKAEMALLRTVANQDEYKSLIHKTLRSHVESELPKSAISDIREVNEILEKIELAEKNNPKIPHMICGYFEDIRQSLRTLLPTLNKSAKLAFVVGNSRWGGVVVPVDHLLSLIAEKLGYHVEKILVTRLKGNSPQQMRKYGKIPLRESVVILRAP